MTLKLLQRIALDNNIPDDVTIMSDSGWECNATNIRGVFCNRKEKIIVFTQDELDNKYVSDSNWQNVSFTK